jgi:hypothetical protein
MGNLNLNEHIILAHNIDGTHNIDQELKTRSSNIVRVSFCGCMIQTECFCATASLCVLLTVSSHIWSSVL